MVYLCAEKLKLIVVMYLKDLAIEFTFRLLYAVMEHSVVTVNWSGQEIQMQA